MEKINKVLSFVLVIAIMAVFLLVGTGCGEVHLTDEVDSSVSSDFFNIDTTAETTITTKTVTTITETTRITTNETKKPTDAEQKITYVLNTKTKKFHKLSCSWLPDENRKDTKKSREEIVALGYVPCKRCHP